LNYGRVVLSAVDVEKEEVKVNKKENAMFSMLRGASGARRVEPALGLPS